MSNKVMMTKTDANLIEQTLLKKGILHFVVYISSTLRDASH